MAVLQACVDESGKLIDTAAVAFGGCLGYQHDFAVLSTRWSASLRDCGIKYIGMAEAMSFKKEFAGWQKREQERDALLLHLVKLGQQYACGIFGMPIASEYFKSLSQEQQRLMKNPTYMGFESCINIVLEKAKKSSRHSVELYCDLSEEYSTTCLKLFNILRMRRPDVKQYFTSITFADEAVFPPLQLADMYAYCIREKTQGPVRPLVAELLNMFGYLESRAEHFACQWPDDLGSMRSTPLD